MISPVFEQFSNKYTAAVFLKVDVDVCRNVASSQQVTAMPTFMFYRKKVKIARIQGANPDALEAKIRELVGNEEGEDTSSSVPGYLDLASMINKESCECLNESDDHNLAGALTSNSSAYLESDCDEQLIISLAFSQPVKLHSLKIEAPTDSGPKFIKLFINQPCTLSFDQAESMEPIQALDLTQKNLEESIIPLRFVKFQNVQTLLVSEKSNRINLILINFFIALYLETDIC